MKYPTTVSIAENRLYREGVMYIRVPQRQNVRMKEWKGKLRPSFSITQWVEMYRLNQRNGYFYTTEGEL